MRYPKTQPWQCTISWWMNKGYYCYNTQQKLGFDGSPDNPKCVACREFYSDIALQKRSRREVNKK